MAGPLQPGHTLLVPSGPAGNHLFVLVLGPVVIPLYGGKEQFAMVGVTSIRDGVPHDPACELNPGDHPFIQHPSYVKYRDLRVNSCAHVENMVGTTVWPPHHPCSAELLQRIVAGICLSKLTPREYKLVFGCG